MAGLGRPKVGEEFDHVLRELVRISGQVPAQRAGGNLVGARRSTEPEVHTARVERSESSKLLSYDERGVVR